MDVKKLKWCCKQSAGLKIDTPNDNLAKEYLQSAEETLSILQDIKGKSNMWLATTKYYCEYFSIYALLQKIGIKCEIHDCTIEIAKLLEEIQVIPNGYSKKLEEDKEQAFQETIQFNRWFWAKEVKELNEYLKKQSEIKNSIMEEDKNGDKS